MPAEPSAPVMKGQTILVVDDQAQIRSLIRQTLERHGAVILEAANGLEALAIRKRSGSALTLVIVQLPDAWA